MKRLLLLLTFAATAGLHAQTNETVIDRSQQPKPPAAPATATGETFPGGDQDAGTQRIAQPRGSLLKFLVSYDAQVYFTNNVFLTRADPVDAVIVANTFSVRAETPSWAVAGGLLTPSLGFTFQRYNHGLGTQDAARKSLDFDSYSLPLNLRFRFGENWEANLGFTTSSIYRLNGPPDYHFIFRSYTPALSLNKAIGLTAHQILSLSAGASYAFTKADTDSTPTISADRNDKYDVFASAGYYYFHDKWTVGPYASVIRSTYRHYEEFGPVSVNRRDTTCSLGASVNYAFNPHASARLFTSFDWRNSTSQIYTYDAANAGVGLTLSATF
jgi:hypothetical protein